MNIIIIILIFCLVLFLYLHIFFHLKTSDDLEVYEVANISKERLEEICDLRQPLILDDSNQKLHELKIDNVLKNYSSFDIKLRNIENFYLENSDEIFLPITLEKGMKVLTEDENNKYISENNSDFLQETSLIKIIQSNDQFIRPHMMMSYEYDYILGSINSTTPLRYEKNYRNYFIVLNGSVKVKITPPKSSKYLHPDNDYENFEFKSLINIWNVQDKYKIDFDKVKYMEVDLKPGKIIFIPAYWWYSFKFMETNSSIVSLKYRTYMNNIAIFPSIFISFLQKQNIKHEVINKIAKNE
tara:strand:- start:7897 stop:8790 length:894 start_codon:yes stop_codon:yes gene_type:complete